MSEILDQLFDATNPALIDQLYTSLYDSPNIETVLANILETGSSADILAEVQTRVSESDFWNGIRSSISNEKGEHVVFQQNKELSGTYTSFLVPIRPCQSPSRADNLSLSVQRKRSPTAFFGRCRPSTI